MKLTPCHGSKFSINQGVVAMQGAMINKQLARGHVFLVSWHLPLPLMNPCVVNRPELFRPRGLSSSDVESVAFVPDDREGPVLGALLYTAEDTVTDVVTGGVG